MGPFKLQKNFVYKINKSNVGFDKNLLQVAEMAGGDYVMFLGNDDVVVEKGLVELVNILEKQNPDAVFSNYTITAGPSNKPISACKVGNFESGKNFDWVLQNLKEKITFISSITIKRKCLNLDGDLLHKYVDMNFMHMVLLFESLGETCAISYCPVPCVNAYDANPAGYDEKKVFLKDLGPIVNSYEGSYEKYSLNSFKAGVLRHVIGAGGVITVSDLIEYRLVTIESLFYLLLSRNNLWIKLRGLRDRIKSKIKSSVGA